MGQQSADRVGETKVQDRSRASDGRGSGRGRSKLLGRERETELAQLIEAGREAEKVLAEGARGRAAAAARVAAEAGRAARDEFVLANQGLVWSLARRYGGRGVAVEDLASEGNLGLIKAVERFDWRRGWKFSTYATWWVQQAISRGVEYGGEAIRLPSHVMVREKALGVAETELSAQTGRRPAAAEIAEATGVGIEEVRAWRERRSVVSLETPIGEDGDGLLSEVVADPGMGPEEAALRQIEADEAEAMVLGSAVLRKREIEVLCLRFGLGGESMRTLTEVAEAMGVTPERIRQIEMLAIAKLRKEEWVKAAGRQVRSSRQRSA